MASNALSSRLEELRSRNPQSPPSERVYSGYNTPTRYSGSFANMHSQAQSQSIASSNDPRANPIQRRFTADSNTFPTPLSPVGYSSMDGASGIESYQQAQAVDKKRMELEQLREQKKRMEEEFKKITAKQAQTELDVATLAANLHKTHFSPGRQSEPTTPPEYRDVKYYSADMANRNRYSLQSLASPTGINRMSRAGSQVASPPNELVSQNGTGGNLHARSNRYSMPVTSMRPKRESIAEPPPLGHLDTTSMLFRGENDDHEELVTSPAAKRLSQANSTDHHKFPVLLRSNHHGTLSASSAALGHESLQSPTAEKTPEANGWPAFNTTQHASKQSLPQNGINGRGALHTANSSIASVDTVIEAPTARINTNRYSLEAALGNGRGLRSDSMTHRPTLANVQSFSTNDIPTLARSGPHSSNVLSSPTAELPEKGFHRANASMSRISGMVPQQRLSRDLHTGESLADEPPPVVSPPKVSATTSEWNANATPFGPIQGSATANNENVSSMDYPAMQQYNNGAYFGYDISMLNAGMNQMSLSNGGNYGNGIQYYSQQPQAPYGGFNNNNNWSNSNHGHLNGRTAEIQSRGGQQRRNVTGEGKIRRGLRRDGSAHSDADASRYNGTTIDKYIGEIYTLCKDQHGCRYLQKQLENRHPETVQTIFDETAPHVVELMTDPFGNYLCQKLLEHTNDEQRTQLVKNAAPHMVAIALNQHGTRALQKMIEYLSTPEQITIVRNALEDKVVDLIQDLNGNHVIQKCLNRLTSEDSQFIFNTVGRDCVIVGTHRHGCCVLQRCIDHASGHQKTDLVAQITENAFKLIQDPYGNYVLQYIIDLQEPAFTNPLCYTFQTKVVELSRHKFSSNVIEKCIRNGAPEVASLLIEEMLPAGEIERMLRDSFANYVVQTALDYATDETRERLVSAILPILPSIKTTPHGRRIAAKVSQSGATTRTTSPDAPLPGVSPPILGPGLGPGRNNRNASGGHQANRDHHQFWNQAQQNGFSGNNFANNSSYNQMGGPVTSRATSHGSMNNNPGYGYPPGGLQNGHTNGFGNQNGHGNQNGMPQNGMHPQYGRNYNFF